MIGRKVRLTAAAAAAALAATVSAVALPAAPASAAQCVNLTGTRYTSGLSRYARVRNICSGDYEFRIHRTDGWNTECYGIGGYVTDDYFYSYSIEGVTPTGIVYC